MVGINLKYTKLEAGGTARRSLQLSWREMTVDEEKMVIVEVMRGGWILNLF